MAPTHYQVLGIATSASLDDIKKAYRNLAKTHHPDKAKSPEEKAKLEDLFAAITTAYNILKDDEQRKSYDAALAKAPSPLSSGPVAPAGAAAAAAVAAAASPAGKAPTGTAAAGGSPGASKDTEKGRKDVGMRAFAQGMKLYQIGDYARALDFLRAAVQSWPEEAQFHDRLATCLLRLKRNFSEALSSAQKAAEMDPYKSDYKMHLAELYEAVGSHDKALATYKDILQWDPDNLAAREHLKAVAADNTPMAKLRKWYYKFVGRS
jgi:curved DNA-binding protein CbpA